MMFYLNLKKEQISIPKNLKEIIKFFKTPKIHFMLTCESV